jgi:dihydroorotate dehydrogenase (fumarate)
MVSGPFLDSTGVATTADKQMFDLSTRYLGLDLAHPFVPGASPLADDLGMVLRLQDAGAPAIVMSSLFEEDVVRRGTAPDRYLEQLLRIKQRTKLPVIASLNGVTSDGWLRYARLIERAGADALELNFYYVACSPVEDGAAVERRVLDIVAVLKESVGIPLAVKLLPFYSALAHVATRLDALGVDGLVLFNRFYEPDMDPETLQATFALSPSASSELALRLRWIAVLFDNVRLSLAVTGGVHGPLDAVKAVLAGADCVQLVSALLEHGPSRLARIRDGFGDWAEEHGYSSLREMRGLGSVKHAKDAAVCQRGHYVRLLQSWQRVRYE